MNVSPAGRHFIEQNEGGCQCAAYWDVDGYSIGYGHHSAGVTQGMVITQEQADALLASDLVWVERAVSSAIHFPLVQNQFDALADFVYNEGAGSLVTSTLARLINAGVNDPVRITSAFLMWSKVQDHGSLVVAPGLVARRKAEAKLFLTP